jgi:hypothetical protein
VQLIHEQDTLATLDDIVADLDIFTSFSMKKQPEEIDSASKMGGVVRSVIENVSTTSHKVRFLVSLPDSHCNVSKHLPKGLYKKTSDTRVSI